MFLTKNKNNKVITTYEMLRNEFSREVVSSFYEKDIYFSSSMVDDGLMKKSESFEKGLYAKILLTSKSGYWRDYKVIKVKPFSTDDEKLFFVHFSEKLGKGTFAKVFKAYELTKKKKKGKEAFKVERTPYIVRKLETEQVKSSIGFENVQYYGGVGVYTGKNSTFQVMEQFGLFDFRYYLSLQKNKYIDPKEWGITYTSLSAYSRQLSEWGFVEPQRCLNFFFYLLPSEKVNLAREMIKGIREIHQGNKKKNVPPLLHRDLKPENIANSVTCGKEERLVHVNFLDLDSSIPLEDDGSVWVKNNPGTFLYAAPENFPLQENVEWKLTTASDLYSFCPIFAEMFGAEYETLYRYRKKARYCEGESQRCFINSGYLLYFAFQEGSFFIPKAPPEVKSAVIFVLDKLQAPDPINRPDSNQLLESLDKLYEIARAIEMDDESKDISKDIYKLCKEMRQAVDVQPGHSNRLTNSH
ncbi:MAG: protein kinase [Gammaproteobacteria bacterium]|nr:protein kinase [Gammaproteobacteria bacterium]MBU2546565.1 protein kinase [Gammaproteobacteria bacterium]